MKSGRTVYLVRHAVAAERDDQKWPDDAKRPLTHAGAARMRAIVKGMVALGVEIDLILTSPLMRAVETADILGRGLRPAPEIQQVAALGPDGAPARMVEAIAAAAGRASAVAVVGHEPSLGELAAWLIGARTPPPFKKGGACRIDVAEWPPARTGQLVWLATPKMLRSL
jgi:phosphohistidine phosphatase